MPHQSAAIIEGSYRVISSEPRPFARSPNRRRLAARIAFWNLAAVCAVIVLPHLIG